MESMDSSTGSQQQPQLPPGFRFHPTDEELVVHYLQKKATSAPLPVVIIAEVDLYKFDPWELPAKAIFGEQEWYFFTPRDRKYPNGARPNRAATSGYWKATGTDKPVLTCGGTQKAGVKKALVFYGGKPPKGIKTNWIMHEYRLADKNKSGTKPPGCAVANKKDSSRLDDWVLCRIYKKNNIQRSMDHESCDSMNDMVLPSILPCLQIGQENLKLETNYGENEENMFERDRDGSSISISLSGSKPQISLPSSNLLSKQNLPTLFWDEVPSSSASSSKRFLSDAARADDNGSIASFLSQLPQNSQLMLGNLGDGGFRNTACELPGMNWYS